MPYPYYQYPTYNQMLYQQMQNSQPQNMQQTPQIQNGGFVIVKDINEAMNYPVAPGNSVTFKNENQPYIYTKTLGFSQLDQPIFEIFKLIKEDNNLKSNEIINETTQDIPVVEYFSIGDGETLKNEVDCLKAEIEFLKELIAGEGKEGDSE